MTLADGVEERDPERRFVGSITRPSPRRLDGGEVCRVGVEEELEGCGAAQALVGSEAEVVEEGELQPLLDILHGECEL